MSKRELLPYPFALSLEHEHCGQCGYLLEGIPAPGICPECGLGFDEGVCALRIAGVAKSSAGPKWRKPAWIVIAILAYLSSNFAVILIPTSPLIALGMGTAIVAGVIAMAVTGRQKKTGTEEFTFSRFGYSRWTLRTSESECDFVAWAGVERAFTVTRVSAYWSKLKLRSINERGRRTTDLDLGFRCQGKDILIIEKILLQLSHGEGFTDLERLELIPMFTGDEDSGERFYVSLQMNYM